MSFDTPERPLEFWKAVEIMQIDLPDAIRRGVLAPVDLAPMLRNCALCPDLRKCTIWQQGHRHGDAPYVPDFCPNQKALEALAASASYKALRRPDSQR